MAERLIVPQIAGGLGDWISLTPALRAARDAGRDPLVLAPDGPHTREDKPRSHLAYTAQMTGQD